MDEFNLLFILLLICLGVIAGVINVMAGGGSNLTVPMLMIMGLPADIANGTNRVAVLLHSIVSTHDFDKHEMLPREDIVPILIPTLLGGLLGGLAASFLPVSLLKPTLLFCMLAVATLILLKPSTLFAAADEKPKKLAGNTVAWLSLFGAGVYGGFVQAGVGFLLITALAGSLRYDLVRTNALKMICTLAFTLIALTIFIWRGQVEWIPGLILAIGTMTGAKIGVKLALKASQKSMKWFLFIMTLVVCLAALIF